MNSIKLGQWSIMLILLWACFSLGMLWGETLANIPFWWIGGYFVLMFLVGIELTTNYFPMSRNLTYPILMGFMGILLANSPYWIWSMSVVIGLGLGGLALLGLAYRSPFHFKRLGRVLGVLTVILTLLGLLVVYPRATLLWQGIWAMASIIVLGIQLYQLLGVVLHDVDSRQLNTAFTVALLGVTTVLHLGILS